MTDEQTFHFGTDETAEFDTLAQVERLPDGTLRFDVVQITKD